MISISTPTFDLDGNVLAQEAATSDMRSETRRVSRSATLDGGVSMPDMGFAHGDRTFSVTIRKATKAMVDQVSYLQRNYPQLMLANEEGVFLGSVSAKRLRRGDLIMTYLVKEKLTED